jgi:predicted nucleotidyltransferase
MDGPEQENARPASIDDLKVLLRALNQHGVDYLLIGGYALYALGYQRGTTDIDVMLRPTREQGERVKQALLLLPDKVSQELMPEWFTEGETIRVADAFVVDLMFTACGETYESLLPYAVSIDFDGVTVRTLNLEGLLKTKQTSRDKDKLDRAVLERALEESNKR